MEEKGKSKKGKWPNREGYQRYCEQGKTPGITGISPFSVFSFRFSAAESGGYDRSMTNRTKRCASLQRFSLFSFPFSMRSF